MTPVPAKKLLRLLKLYPVLLLLSVSPALAAPAENEEIDYLLAEIAASGCQFVRNGESHDASAAAEHLAMKYRRARRFVADAEQFIARIASGSSWSGKPYYVACSGGIEVPSATWLSSALHSYRGSE